MFQVILCTFCYHKAVTITLFFTVFVYIIYRRNKKTVQKQVLLHGFGCHNIGFVVLPYVTTSSNWLL